MRVILSFLMLMSLLVVPVGCGSGVEKGTEEPVEIQSPEQLEMALPPPGGAGGPPPPGGTTPPP